MSQHFDYIVVGAGAAGCVLASRLSERSAAIVLLLEAGQDTPPDGAESDRCAVVDAAGRVHGVGGLRVADASIMPNIVAGNTNIPTIMLAEKIASAMLGSS